MGIFDRRPKSGPTFETDIEITPVEEVLAEGLVPERLTKKLKMSGLEIMIGKNLPTKPHPELIDLVMECEITAYMCLGPAFKFDNVLADAKQHRMDGVTQEAYNLMTCHNIRRIIEAGKSYTERVEVVRRDTVGEQIRDFRVVCRRLALVFHMREWMELKFHY